MVDDIRPSFGPKKTASFTPTEPPEEPEIPDPIEDEPSPPEEPEPSLMSDDSGSIGTGKLDETPPKKRLHHKITELGLKIWPSTKKQRIIGIIVVLLLLIIGGTAIYAIQKNLNKRAPTVAVAKKAPEPPKTTEPSKLTGVEIPIETNKRPVTSIQIENSPDARPQSGLLDAGVVFEAIAEGGITRFNASFLEAQPDYIGPIRSVRPYYVDLVAPFDPIFVHAGGSADGLAQLRSVGLKDLDHGANASAFKRVSDRYAPHNLYSSMAELDKASQGRGYTTSNVKGFVRAQKEAPNPAPTAKSIDFSLSGFLYNSHFDYDTASNSYLRSQAGKPHTDHRSGKQLAPKTVVAIVTDYSTRGIYSVYRTTGSGQVFIFQNGVVTPGTWTKNSVKDQFTFADATGKPIQLNPGQTWVTMVGNAGSVVYKP